MSSRAVLLSAGILCAALLAAPRALGDSSNQSWLLFEQGNSAASQKDYGNAMELYKEAVQAAGIFPEAEAAIGDVYLEEGEAALAQRQYQKAYDERKSLYIPDQQYGIMYKLANLFEIQQAYNQMEAELGQIVADDKRFQETSTQHLRTQVEKNFVEKGLDRVLMLYDFEDSFSAPAHSKLGWFYYRTGRFSQSVSHLLYSVVYRSSRIRNLLRERNSTYEFTDASALLASIEQSADLRSYAQSAGLYKDLYYLAGSMFANGYPRHATALWSLLKACPSAGQYQDLAVRQLKKPFMEPLLTVTR
ncbi:MAG TPA: hypothetical protein VFH83_08970 [Spirochaetia bacterium]|nr:hypothetical protein [Spirochaetia bacterium]